MSASQERIVNALVGILVGDLSFEIEASASTVFIFCGAGFVAFLIFDA